MSMNIWITERWQAYYKDGVHRKGLRVICEPNVNPEVNRACKEFVAWLRKQYLFPKRVRLYIKASIRIKSIYGDRVCGTFFRPSDRDCEPYIRIATGDYEDLLKECGMDEALAAILWTIAHELTHYFQWLNDIQLTLIGEERQATIYANQILKDYAEIRDHP